MTKETWQFGHMDEDKLWSQAEKYGMHRTRGGESKVFQKEPHMSIMLVFPRTIILFHYLDISHAATGRSYYDDIGQDHF